jgi:hypothetical protein
MIDQIYDDWSADLAAGRSPLMVSAPPTTKDAVPAAELPLSCLGADQG